VSNNFNMKFPK